MSQRSVSNLRVDRSIVQITQDSQEEKKLDYAAIPVKKAFQHRGRKLTPSGAATDRQLIRRTEAD